ncbi:MAG: LamG domain-containing protein [Ignavibacteriae bacterium]|nr:LamG domain-containing protein [Ignavibacteriota bacterium]
MNPTKVEIIFSEAILEIDVQNISNYSINNGITVSEAEVETPTKVILTTSEHTSGNYTVTVNNIKDLAGNIISSSNNTASYSVQVDTILPDLISVEVLSPTSIKVIYSEKVQKSGAENISNYSIDNGIIIVSSLLSPSEKEVILSTSEHAGGSYTITVNNILDLAGNMIQPNSTKQYNVEEDSVSPELTSISLVDKNTLEVFFSEPINETDAENISNYIIESGITINSANLANSTKVTLTTSTHAVGEYTIMVSNIHDISGNVITSNNSLSYSYFPESPKPELLYAFAPQNNLVEVVFSKPVSQATAEDIQNYSISDNINVINAILKNSGEEVSLEVSELTADFHYTLTVENIQDLQGNTISPDSNSTVFCYLNNPGPIALYDFTEGMNSNIVYDISCNGAPLHLTISNLSAITWLEGGGMSVNSNVIISSDIAAKLNNNCKQTNALTIEAWIKPANSTQNGPARIVSLSNDRSNRNFTLGQGEGSNNTYGYDVRLRTSATSNNGVPSVTATSPAITTNLTHVVYTRSSEGETKIYIDGLESFSTTFNGNLSNWDNSFKLILANEMTGDRPWLGSFYKVAIYDKALDSDEVQTTFTEFNNTMLTNLRVFLEGPYNSGNMSTNLLDDQVIPLDQPYSAEPWNYDGYERVAEIPNDIVDWVLVEVRSDDTTIVAKRAAFLRKDGKVVDLNGISNVAFKDLASDEYYISIIHRNHLSILSADKVNIGNHSQLLDMTKAENVFGSESVSDLGNGVFGMYAGDTNCSSIITYADAMGIVQKNTKSGYNIADVNLSGIVTYADVTHVVNNNTKSANFKVNK